MFLDRAVYRSVYDRDVFLDRAVYRSLSDRDLLDKAVY
jgi:hypothetical protein